MQVLSIPQPLRCLASPFTPIADSTLILPPVAFAAFTIRCAFSLPYTSHGAFTIYSNLLRGMFLPAPLTLILTLLAHSVFVHR
ncbi:hypothetical protein BD626DRAFT_523587 [Schizophyllum amplum]|uniref:Uncharacterized protein n=1 Tax=Schizophyllum amplum TaxID=97359 RepID=A0A550BSZ8_9AGAR|nr:hypothetical protein BD626DRAFT_523587 [Auriculariopsis ampla]